jgi:hypothetical protein
MKWSEITPLERNSLTAERVMGWRWYRGLWNGVMHRTLCLPAQNPGTWELADGTEPIGGFIRGQYAVPEYSEDIARAMQVVKHMTSDDNPPMLGDGEPHKLHFGLTYRWGDGPIACAHFDWKLTGDRHPLYQGFADTVSEAICLAALRAVGVEVED